MATKRGYACRDVPDGLCYCRCHAIGMSWKPRRRKRPDAYLPRHDDAVRAAVAAGDHPAAIAAALTERFGIARTEGSVRQRMRKLGLSTREGWWSRDDVIRKLGISDRKLIAIEAAGFLAEKPFGRWRRYRTADLDRLVREQAGLSIDPRRVKDARLRALAEVASIENRRRQSA